ncbi:MAG: BamA/TamA family outer membrane protein [Burkholderiales bacterium]|nr:BamA/TamA family outer membrane protein [Burkholderiales bacterium]
MPLPASRTRVSRCWLLALTLASAVAFPTLADAQTAPEGAAHLRADAAIRYRVEIVAPDAIAATLRAVVDLVRWQDFDEMTEDLFDRLARDAVPQSREAAATQGFFSAGVDITVDRSTQPVSVTLHVTPGLPTRIAGVAIDVTGPATETPEGNAAIATLRDTWLLPKADVFLQGRWTEAKTAAVATLAASPYAAARLEASEARIDPEARSADLSLKIASGPPFRIGTFEVRGLERYTPKLVHNFATLHEGDLYGAQPLDDYVRRLLASGYFASVQASIDTDVAQADHATVTLSVIEAPTRHVEFGVGYSTDTEFKLSAAYSDVNVDGHGMQMYTNARLESKVQQADIRFVRPPTSGGWIDTYAATLQRTDIENLVTRTAAVTVRRRAIEERRTPAFGLGFYVNEEIPEGGSTDSSHALYLDGEYTWRNVDDLLSPTRGWMANVQTGVGLPGASTETFGRVVGRVVAWWPLSDSNALTARVDAGAVIAPSRIGIPSNFLFRTGGDTTVRGYAYESLGVQQGAAVVGGRYYAVGSVEIEHWITPSWGLAAFVDAGNATDSLDGFDPALGYGVGGRLRTPIGPFRLDVAYGQESHSVRLHFSVGLSF